MGVTHYDVREARTFLSLPKQQAITRETPSKSKIKGTGLSTRHRRIREFWLKDLSPKDVLIMP